MSKNKNDRILDNLEKIIGFIVLSLAGIVSYFFINMDDLTPLKMMILSTGIIFYLIFLMIAGVIYKKIFDKIKWKV